MIVRTTQDARNGEIVVALVGDDESADEATVKTFLRKGTTISLIPANSRLEPMVFDADQVQIFGRVVTVMRRL